MPGWRSYWFTGFLVDNKVVIDPRLLGIWADKKNSRLSRAMIRDGYEDGVPFAKASAWLRSFCVNDKRMTKQLDAFMGDNWERLSTEVAHDEAAEIAAEALKKKTAREKDERERAERRARASRDSALISKAVALLEKCSPECKAPINKGTITLIDRLKHEACDRHPCLGWDYP